MLAGPSKAAHSREGASSCSEPSDVIHTHTDRLKKRGGLLATVLLASSFMPSFAGETVSKSTSAPSIIEKAPESNPLSFCNGLFTLDIQERLRWEIRENNFDFNDDLDSLTDDNWFLNRFRVG